MTALMEMVAQSQAVLVPCLPQNIVTAVLREHTGMSVLPSTTAIPKDMIPSQVVFVPRLLPTTMAAALWDHTGVSLWRILQSDSETSKLGADVGVLNHVALYVILIAHDAKQAGIMSGSPIDIATEMRDYRVSVRRRDLSSAEAKQSKKHCHIPGLTQGAILSPRARMLDKPGGHQYMFEMIGRPVIMTL